VTVTSRHVILALAVAAIAGLGWTIVVKTGPLTPPWQRQPPAPEGRDDPAPSAVVVAASEHQAGVKFIPHRYPQRVGMGVTAVMHHGYSGIRVPHTPEARWITSPPSEVIL
jgi:hypothetical protein